MKKAEFLKSYQKFQLEGLPTEAPHPMTDGLSDLVHSDLQAAISRLKEVDLKALSDLIQKHEEISKLRAVCQNVLSRGNRIFLCGCGATGRLSMLLEFLFREKYSSDQVVSFMAGGDVALVHSLEGFEDYPELGARHLMQMGFTENDFLISVTEGGETPYVIGATEKAAQVSKEKPYFIFCNPVEVLKQTVERSREVLENEDIQSLCLFVGPMALSGSTRMQASTVLQLAVGVALVETDGEVNEILSSFVQEVETCDFTKLAPLIRAEFEIYQQGEFLMYQPYDFAISVFTDTTERSPTFSLPSFESNNYQGSSPSLCYIQIPRASTAEQAWHQLLRRKPVALDWNEIDPQTSKAYLENFDFSKNSIQERDLRLRGKPQHLFSIMEKQGSLKMTLKGVEQSWNWGLQRSLLKHTLLKLVLNVHSTLLMGLMDRYRSNVMTWVRPTNGKLVDRATRYIRKLLQEEGIEVDYLDVVDKIYELHPEVQNSQCIVLNVFHYFLPPEHPAKRRST